MKIGTTDIKDVKFGETQVTKIMLGGEEVWKYGEDELYIYAGGRNTQTVRKYLKSDMSYIGETVSYGGNIYSLVIDDTHIYVGGIMQKVSKYLKSDMSYVGETGVSYGGYIYTIAMDDTYIYVGGATTNRVRKYLKSDLSYIGETESYGGTIYSIAIEN